MSRPITADAVRELVERLVAIDSVNPTLVPGGAGEREVAEFIAEWLEASGVDVELQTLADDRVNVIGRIRGRGGGRTLILNGHTDTVALGGDDAALTPRLANGRLFGRGSYDMKSGVAAIMLAAAAVRRDLGGDVVVTAVADEEALSVGTEAVVGTVSADAAIVVEPTELAIATAHKGFVWLELETTGVASHGSRYDVGVDAIARIGPTLVGIAELDRRLRAERAPHALLGGASLHASLIEGGQELSTYPDRCLVKVERRTLPGETVTQVEEEIAAIAGEANVKSFFSREPLETSTEEPIVQALVAAATPVLGRSPAIVGMAYWADSGLLAGAGIPSVLFGPSGAGAHADVEWVDVESVVTCANVLVAAAEAFCD